ncbi:MAG: DUF2520 domain-containing protein [Eubacterium sp.]|nr:DUF2520 domain-containing protein [Eubacterium sp.]
MKKIGFIGAGKVACSMGRYLTENGIPVTGYSCPNRESVDYAATFTQTKAFSDNEEVILESDIIFIATPDGVISSVWESINKQNISGKIFAMFSGSLSSDLFSGIDAAGAYAASIHPMFAFSDRNSDYLKMNNISFTVEGDKTAVNQLLDIFEGKLGHSVTVIEPKDKTRYHAAAATASNLMIGLYDMSLSMLVSCGFTEEAAAEIIRPLVENNAKAMLEKGAADALTGPVERCDTETVKKHLEVLSPEEKAVYIPLTKRLINISKTLHPERPYNEMEKLLISND